jgi:hypothetical protein
MKLSANAEAIFKDMEIQHSRCITRLYEKEYFQSALDGHIIMGYKRAITDAFDSDCVTKDEAAHLLEGSKVMPDDE